MHSILSMPASNPRALCLDVIPLLLEFKPFNSLSNLFIMAFTVRRGDPGSSNDDDGDGIIEYPVDTRDNENYRDEEDNANNLDDEILALATVREL